MTDAILVINAGSSSIKFSVFAAKNGELTQAFRGQVEGLFTSPHFIAKDAAGSVMGEKSWGDGVKLGHEGAIEYLRVFLRENRGDLRLAGMGHRIVHGGLRFFEPVRIDAEVVADLEKLVPLAPLHQPNNLAAIRLVLEKMPDVPQVGCFDTGFHHTNPQLAQLFAIPKELTDAGVRRYGFHGLSYEYIASVLPEKAPQAAKGKTVVLHLGSGSSMCALAGGQSIATTMGFSALDGLAMGTRCGALDPGVILFLLDQRKMELRSLEKLLYSQSGLLGVSGISSDVRILLESKDPRAKLALDLFVYRIGRELGSLAAALGGLDAMIFTAGVGENAVKIREAVCRNAEWLGVDIDPAANARGGPRITKSRSRVAAWVLPTNEELMIARHTLLVLGLRRRRRPARELAAAA
ncbi:MAG: acetate kinase [Verrucomicrobia bacterium]|nr:MAG: acetate kinase [Verrucomicrobiota bacterium]